MRTVLIALLVAAVLMSRSVWSWSAAHVWIPHQGLLIAALLAVEFCLGYVAGRQSRIR